MKTVITIEGTEEETHAALIIMLGGSYERQHDTLKTRVNTGNERKPVWATRVILNFDL